MRIVAFVIACLSSLDMVESFVGPSPVKKQSYSSTRTSISAFEYDLYADVLSQSLTLAEGGVDIEAVTGIDIEAVTGVDIEAVTGVDIEALTEAAAGLDISPIAVGGVAAALLAAAAFLTQGTSGGATDVTKKESRVKKPEPKPKPEQIDVSIPYDAAARLAYEEWCSQYEAADEIDAEDFFPKFKTLYEELAVAEVVQKRKEREFADLSKGMSLKRKIVPEKKTD